MDPAGLQMATHALVLLLAARSGDGVDRSQDTVEQDVKLPLETVMEEAAQIPLPQPSLHLPKALLQVQPAHQLRSLAVTDPL